MLNITYLFFSITASIIVHVLIHFNTCMTFAYYKNAPLYWVLRFLPALVVLSHINDASCLIYSVVTFVTSGKLCYREKVSIWLWSPSRYAEGDYSILRIKMKLHLECLENLLFPHHALDSLLFWELFLRKVKIYLFCWPI